MARLAPIEAERIQVLRFLIDELQSYTAVAEKTGVSPLLLAALFGPQAKRVHAESQAQMAHRANWRRRGTLGQLRGN